MRCCFLGVPSGSALHMPNDLYCSCIVCTQIVYIMVQNLERFWFQCFIACLAYSLATPSFKRWTLRTHNNSPLFISLHQSSYIGFDVSHIDFIVYSMYVHIIRLICKKKSLNWLIKWNELWFFNKKFLTRFSLHASLVNRHVTWLTVSCVNYFPLMLPR